MSILFPILMAFLVWLISGRRIRAASITFNIVLTLVLFSQLPSPSNINKQKRPIINMMKQQKKLQNKISNYDTSAKNGLALTEYLRSIEQDIKELANTGAGSEKRFYQILLDAMTESNSIAREWERSFRLIRSDSILNFDILSDEKEFSRQINIINRYIENSIRYESLFHNMVPNLKARLSILDHDNEYAKGAIEGATKKYQTQKPIFDPLIMAHINYGTAMSNILNLLKNNTQEWSYKNEELQIHTDEVLTEFNSFINTLNENEITIDTLSLKLLKAL